MPQNKTRSKKKQKYQSFRLQKKIRPPQKPIAWPLKLFKQSVRSAKLRWRLLLGSSMVYAVLYLLLVRGIGAIVSVESWRDRFDLSTLGQNLNIFSEIVTGASPRSGAAGVFQVVLFVTFSMSLLAIFRAKSSDKLGVRDTYYFGTSQFVPFFIVLVFALLMLVPIGIGSAVIETARLNNLIVSNWEQAGFLLFGLALAAVTFYLLAGALFSLIVVSLQGVSPGEAIKTGWRLVEHRRGQIAWRLAVLVLILALIVTAVVLPVVFIYAPAAEFAFYGVSVVTIVMAHSYIYQLYQEMIG